MLATALIVFRESLEAGLIVGIVLASTRGVPGRGRWTAAGVAAGVAGSLVVAAFASQLAELFEGTGQELFNATVLLMAVAMLTWHNLWMAAHGRALVEETRRLGAAVAAGRRPLVALSVVCGVSVLREGSETVLFLTGVASAGSTTMTEMLAGGAAGLAIAVAVAALLYLGLLSVPVRRLFAVTSLLVTLLAAGLASQAVAFLQQAGYLALLTATIWDTSRVLPEGSLAGRLLHALVGYTDRPTGAQLVAYVAVVVAMWGLARLVRSGGVARRAAPQAAEEA